MWHANSPHSALSVDVSYMQSEGGDSASHESTLLCHQPTDQYTSAEDHYLTELTAYTKKQFFQVGHSNDVFPSVSQYLQGIAVMAHTPDDSQCGVVDLDDPGNILMKG